MKAGTKLKSLVCDTEVMVIRGSSDGVFECGGAPMVTERGDQGQISSDFSNGTIMGKRYTDETGSIELLCIKPGKGSLGIDGVALKVKDAKPLPSSD
jgi:hypothetical protein